METVNWKILMMLKRKLSTNNYKIMINSNRETRILNKNVVFLLFSFKTSPLNLPIKKKLDYRLVSTHTQTPRLAWPRLLTFETPRQIRNSELYRVE